MSNLTPVAARLEIDLDHEYLRMQNEWFFKWHFIGKDGPVEIDSFNGRSIHYGGIGYSGTARDVYWDTIQRYSRQKVGLLFDALEEQLGKYPLDVKERTLLEAEGLIIGFTAKIRRAAVEKDRILRGNGIEFPPPHDAGHWDGARKEDIESRTATLRAIYCEPRINIEGNEMSLRSMMKDKVTLVKKDGSICRDNIPALVTADQVTTFAADLPIEVGDHFLRHLPNGLVEDFIVIKPDYYGAVGSIQPHFQVKVRRSDEPAASPQTIIAHFTGDNSRMYVNSTDNSVNITSAISKDELSNFLIQIKQSMPALPPEQQVAIKDSLSILEAETAKPEAQQSKIRAALLSIKTVCEGAAGNLVASGIIGLISRMMGG